MRLSSGLVMKAEALTSGKCYIACILPPGRPLPGPHMHMFQSIDVCGVLHDGEEEMTMATLLRISHSISYFQPRTATSRLACPSIIEFHDAGQAQGRLMRRCVWWYKIDALANTSSFGYYAVVNVMTPGRDGNRWGFIYPLDSFHCVIFTWFTLCHFQSHIKLVSPIWNLLSRTNINKPQTSDKEPYM